MPYNIRSIENILNRVYSLDKHSGRKLENRFDVETQTDAEVGVSKIDISVVHNNSLETLKNRSKVLPLIL